MTCTVSSGGAWLASTQIPADRSNYGSFIILDDQAREEVRQLIVAASEKPNRAPGSAAQKVGDYYVAFMDTARVESLGLAPLQAELQRIDAIATPRDVAHYIGYSQRIGVAQPFAWFSAPDNRNSSVYLGALVQTGLTMPDRDYYLNPDEKYARFRARFSEYVERLLALSGERNARSAAARIAALETRIANDQWTKVALRDPVKNYNPMSLPEYQKLAPGFDWLAFFDGMGAPVQRLDVSQPTFIKGIGQLVKTVPVADWRVYFKFRLIDRYAPALSTAFADLEFDFHQRTINGVSEQRPRWRRAVDSMDDNIGELIGQMYVEAHFGADAKRRMLELVQNLLASFDTSIDGLDWMSAATRAEAKKKLSKITVKIGYPDVWRDYSSLAIRGDDLLGNVLRAAQFEHQRYVVRAGGPVDKGEWLMTPQTVNAYYNPTTNEITFPAAILRPPFFDADRGRRGELWRDRFRDRPRDQSRLRRLGPAVRRRRQPAGLVDGRGWRGVQAARRNAVEAVRRLFGARQPAHRRQAHARREHRGLVRHRSRAQGLQAFARRKTCPGDRRVHG